MFGVPTFEVDGELLWGQDPIPRVERFLDGNDAVIPELLPRWSDLPEGAKRPGS